MCIYSLGSVDAPLHTDFVPRLEGGGVLGLGVAEDLNTSKADPVGGAFTLPAALNVEVIQTIVVNLAGGEGKKGRERERERGGGGGRGMIRQMLQ